MGPYEDESPVNESATERDDYPEPEPPVDPRMERMAHKAQALSVARDAVRDTAMFGSNKPLDPIDLMMVADWLLDETGQDTPAAESITPQMLDLLPHQSVILDASGRAHQCDLALRRRWRSLAGAFTSEEMIEARGVEVIYVAGERRGG